MISNVLHFQSLPLTRHLYMNVWLFKMDEIQNDISYVPLAENYIEP